MDEILKFRSKCAITNKRHAPRKCMHIKLPSVCSNYTTKEKNTNKKKDVLWMKNLIICKLTNAKYDRVTNCNWHCSIIFFVYLKIKSYV